MERSDNAGDGPIPSAESLVPSQRRLVDRLDPRLVNVLTVLGFGLPVVGYFWLLHLYSVNVVFGDQWDDVVVIQHSYSHLIDWGSLWAQHNENRIFFPNLIVVFLAHTAHFNIQLEEYLSAVMLIAALALLIWAHKRRSPSNPWLYYCPVALLGLSTVQYENSLWGFQMAWYLVLLSLATAVILIDRVELTPLTLAGAMTAAVVGSFSSLQGLLIWPAGLLLLYHRRRSRAYLVTWTAGAVVSVAIYFFHFNTNATAGSPSHGYALHHPLAAVKFYLFEVGDIVGLARIYNGPGSNPVLLLGVVILVLAGLTLIAYGIRRDDRGGSPIGVALICVGLLFAAIVTAGRIRFGYLGASASRYTTYDLLIPIGIFLTVIGRPVSAPAFRQSDPVSEGGLTMDGGERRGTWAEVPAWIDRKLFPVGRWIIALVILVQIGFGLHYGPEGARNDHAYQAESAHVLRNIDHTADGPVGYYLYLLEPVPFIRREARVLKAHHLSLFAPGNG